MSSRRRTRRRIPPFLGLSLIAHLAILALLASTDLGRGCNSEPFVVLPTDDRPIDVTMIEPTVPNPYATRPNAEEAAKEAEKKAEEARKEEEKPDEGGQVVDTAQPPVEIRPEKAKYLGQYDSKTEHETKAPPSPKAGVGRPQQMASGSRPPQPATPRVPEVPEKAAKPAAPATRGQRGEGGEGALAMRAAEPIPEPPEERGREDGLKSAPEGTEAPRGSPPVASERRRPGGAPGESDEGEPGQRGQRGSPGSEAVPRTNGLQPSEQMLARVVGGGSDDYLKDMDDGDETLLNTKRFRYWSFFDRLKKSVAQKWRPDVAYRLRDPSGQIYGFKNRYTVLKVSLKPDGSLTYLTIETPSGVDFLDDEAVNAMKMAGPFPNPPEGLVDPSSHLITFRFGFMFEVGGAPRFRVYRN